MNNKIYVGGLPYSTTEKQLEELFSSHGSVQSARIIMDKFTGRSKGFGFVEMASAEVAEAAIKALDGMSVDGRSITVNLARPREEGRGPGRAGAAGFTATNRANVGYGNDGYGGRS